jgi:sulfide:quinone oxidoreductase
MVMPRIIVLGAGLGGTIAAYEIRDAVKGKAEVMVVNDQEDYWFVPSNPWVAVRWREADAIKVHLPPIMQRKGIGFTAVGANKVHPQENRVELKDGTSLSYDYLVIATGPDLAFDEVEGLGPEGFTQSVCRTDHAASAAESFDRFCENPGPIVIGGRTGGILLWPGL